MPLVPRSWEYALEQDTPLYASDVRRVKPDTIVSYERYPSRSFDVPVVWITGPSDPAILRRFGVTDAHFERIVAWKGARAERAKRLVFTTRVSLDAFAQQFGEALTLKSTVIPFLIPGLRPVDDISTKWKGQRLKLLFVGREAKRKGLPETLAAVLPLLEQDPELSLTIVSSLSDGPVDVPKRDNIRVLAEVTRAQVLQLMAESHVLVMPSSWESYGFVYIEAMSQGCVPLSLDRPIQRELFGGHGILVSSQEADEIRAAVSNVIENRDQYVGKAAAGLVNYKWKHSPEIIAAQFEAACRE